MNNNKYELKNNKCMIISTYDITGDIIVVIQISQEG